MYLVLLVLVCVFIGAAAGSISRDRLAVANQRANARKTNTNAGAWAPAFIVNNGHRHEVACAPSGDVWMRFDRMLLAKTAGVETPEWISTSEKKGAFIGSRQGNELLLRAWAARLFGNEGVMLLHAPKVAGVDGEVPLSLELSVGSTNEPSSPDFVDELVARLDKQASEKTGAFYRSQGSTVSGGAKRTTDPF